MIPKVFTKTYKLQKELISLEEEEEKVIFKTENPEKAHYIDNEYLNSQKEIHDSNPQEQFKKKITDSFTKEYKELNKSHTYFLGCSLANYEHNYKKRLSEYKTKYIDATDHNFIFEELQNINSFDLPYYINNDIKKNIKFSSERVKEFLKEQLVDKGYKINTSYTDAGGINSLAIKGSSVLKINEEPAIDLSNNTHKDKIIYLELIGFFDFIKEKEPDLSINKTASLVSAITGIAQTTVQSYINPILSNEVGQRNNPLSNREKVLIIKNKLIELNLQNIKLVR